MVECKRIFERVRAEVLSADGQSYWQKNFVFSGFRSNEFSQTAPHSSKSRKNSRSILGHASDRQTSNDGSNDKSTGKRNLEYSLRGRRLQERELNEFRSILSGEIPVTKVSWEACDTKEDLQTSLYYSLARGIVEITNIPKIPAKYESEDRIYYGFDSEDSGSGIPHFYQFATRDSVFISSSFRALIRYVTQRFKMERHNHIVWGTNIEYEFGNIIKDYEQHPKTMEVKWRKSKLNSFRLIYDPKVLPWASNDDFKGNFLVWDTMTHWPLPVKDLGKTLTEVLGFDFAKLPADFYGFKYAAMDAIISRSYACMQKHAYDKKGIELKSTPGATSMGLYTSDSTDFCNTKIYKTHSADQLKWLEEGLRGGRTEVFSLREHQGRIGYYDINSAYPFSMLDYKTYPDPSTRNFIEGHDAIRRLIDQGYEGMTACEVEAVNLQPFAMAYPYLGAKDELSGRFVFPLGKWKAKYTFFEIRNAERLGYKFKFKEAMYYSICRKHPFIDYVNFCYDLRLEGNKLGDPMLSSIGKSLGNNLYGKWGQKKVFTVAEDYKKFNADDILHCARLGDCVLVERNDGYAIHTNMIWGAYITAITRDLLYCHMMRAWENGNVILYCDTDSIFISGGRDPDSDQSKLGALKHEGDLYMFKAYLPKQYEYIMYSEKKQKMVHEYKAKGIPVKTTIEDAQGNKTEVMLREQYFTSGKVEFRKPLKLREALRRKNIKGVEMACRGVDAVNAWVTVEKELKGSYTKREVLESGWTLPLWIGMKKPDWYNPPQRFTKDIDIVEEKHWKLEDAKRYAKSKGAKH
jgi:hypothetical protein